MKKTFTLAIALLMVTTMAFAGGNADASSDGTFTPTRDVTWTCTSSPGGGSDIFTQEIKESIRLNGFSDANIVIDYVTDGGGEVGRLEVSRMTGPRADHTILTFNSGDLMPMCLNTNNRIENFKPLALMASDNHFLCSGDMSKYHSFQEIIDALARGERIVIAGSKGDDIETYNALLKSLGVDETQLAYVTNDSTSSAITSLLGGHVDLVLGKQASCEQYIIAERMFPMVALCEDRFTSDLLKDMPSITEFGYEACDVPNWRGIVAPKAMSEAAADYWAECFRQVTETPEWDEYITRNGLVPMYMDRASTVQFMTEFQQSYLQSIGKDK